MPRGADKNRQRGFAAMEALLVLVIIAALVGVGGYVYLHRNKTQTASNTGTTAQTVKPTGTSENVIQLTEQAGQTEANIDSSADSQLQQNATSANTAASNLGGAYNENNL